LVSQWGSWTRQKKEKREGKGLQKNRVAGGPRGAGGKEEV
jgi:hypothetical protein